MELTWHGAVKLASGPKYEALFRDMRNLRVAPPVGEDME